MNRNMGNVVYSWGGNLYQSSVFLICAASSAVIMVYIFLSGVSEVYCWCVSPSLGGCLILLIFCYFMFLAGWSLWLIFISFNTAIRVSVDKEILEVTLPFGFKRKYKINEIKEINKIKGSNIYPHPLFNKEGVIIINLISKYYWFNPGHGVDNIYEEIKSIVV